MTLCPTPLKSQKKKEAQTPSPNDKISSTTGDNSSEQAQADTTKERVVTKPDEKSETKKSTQKPTKKRMLITGAAAVAVLLVLSAALSFRVISRPAVDEALVNEYLDKQSGSVAGVQTNQPELQSSGSTADNQATTLSQTEKAQAEVPFDATIWENLREPIFGVQFQYPINAVEIMKTDSSITLLRKNGYIFKVQLITTDLPLDEYWEQIKATSLNYTVEEATFAKKDALHLKLDDVTEFPGNRYLVKANDQIYDFWYATPSDAFDLDDLQRVEYLLKTVSILSQ